MRVRLESCSSTRVQPLNHGRLAVFMPVPTCPLPTPLRAKDSWTDRERRNLTSTDVALGAKRKSRGGSRGWKTKASGSKVFVAPGRGGGAAVVSSGQAAFRSSKGFVGGDGGKKKRKR